MSEWKKAPCPKKIGELICVAFDSEDLKIRLTRNIKEDTMIDGYTHWWDGDINLDTMKKQWNSGKP